MRGRESLGIWENCMRRDAREAAFRIVYARLMGGDLGKGARSALYLHMKLSDEERDFAEKLAQDVEAHRAEFDATISERVTRFADYRIYPTDRAAMLIALAEINDFDEIPPVVSVSEAVAIARKYSSENSADFVNGVLAGVLSHEN